MKTLDIDEMTSLLNNQEQRANQQPRVLTVQGEPYAALVPLASLKTGSDEPAVAALKNLLRLMIHTLPQAALEDVLEDTFIDTNPQLVSILDQSRAALEANGGYTAEEMRREFGLLKPET